MKYLTSMPKKTLLLIMLMFCFASCKAVKNSTDSDLDTIGSNKTGRADFAPGTFSITIDDGPTSGVTDVLVNRIKTHNASNPGNPIKATFFVVGNRMSQKWKTFFDDLACDGNFSIGNHTNTHVLNNLAANKIGREIRDSHQVIKSAFPDRAVRFFRAPGGSPLSSAEQSSANSATSDDYVGSIFWDVGGALQGSKNSPNGAADWACWSNGWSVNQCLNGYLAEADRKKRGVVLFHDLDKRSVDLIMGFARESIKRGDRFVRLDEISSLRSLAANVASNSRCPSDGSIASQPTPVVTSPAAQQAANASPCTAQLKGICSTRNSCLDIGLGQAHLPFSSWKDRYGDVAAGLYNSKNLTITSGYCPNDPANIRCCYNPDNVASGASFQISQSSASSDFDSSQTGPISNDQEPSAVGVAKDLTDIKVKENNIQTLSDRSNMTFPACPLDEKDLASRQFYLFTTPDESKVANCNAKILQDEVISGKASHMKSVELAKNCYKETYLLDLYGYGQNAETKNIIADFKLTKVGAASASEGLPAGTVGDVSAVFDKNDGGIIRSYFSIQSANNPMPHASHIPHSHSLNSVYTYQTFEEILKGDIGVFMEGADPNKTFSNPCAMRWAGAGKLKDHGKESFQSYLMMPVSSQ